MRKTWEPALAVDGLPNSALQTAAGYASAAHTGPDVSDAPITLTDDNRFTGPFVRREGPTRRFVYICIGASAGQHGSEWSRRAKIDIHDIPAALLAQARDGVVLEVVLPGRGKDGTPACATVRPLQPWRTA